ncbi:hypothetical protein SAMN05216382_0952 [Sphingomonas palmae]|uniref:Uncharacterized protein n=1 Tax=Sphingomonas palmae TaxID=1855283 RepID=A0A1H7J7G4_9SPHN|nr:hypothetical protein [Sphingomonas palmae]SEK70304.1 hypothetical protein SAMN05216382_0952 [Sphingomonas palmae]
MAKKKKRIPKTIGGVKLPKELRRAGEQIIDQAVTVANSPQGKAMIATGLSMAAAAAMKAAEAKAAKPAAEKPPEKPSPANDARTEESRQPGVGGIDGDAIGQAVEQVLGRLFGRRA